jgi:hypothetical protein
MELAYPENLAVRHHTSSRWGKNHGFHVKFRDANHDLRMMQRQKLRFKHMGRRFDM